MRTYRSRALLATAALLCSCTRSLDMDKVRSVVQTGLASQTGLKLESVACPRKREVKTGDTFECTASSPGGARVWVAVTQTSENGDIAWKLTRSEGVLDLAALQASIVEEIKSKRGGEPTVDCGGKLREARAGDTLTCRVTSGDEQLSAVVTVKDAAGRVEWVLQ